MILFLTVLMVVLLSTAAMVVAVRAL